MSNPNATGRFPFRGPNISEPYPANDSTHPAPLDWAVSLDIKADIPLLQTQDPTVFNNSAYVSGGVLSLTAPVDLVKESLDANEPYRHHHSWKVCAYTRPPPTYEDFKQQKQMHDEGNCQAAWDNECADWLTSAIQNAYMERLTSDVYEDESDCPFFRLDGPCEMSGAWLHGYPVTLNRSDHTMYAPWNMTLSDEQLRYKEATTKPFPEEIGYTNGSAMFQWASNLGEKGNLTAYHQDTGFYWPLVVAFGFNETWMARDANASNMSLPQPPLVSHFCVKAEQVAPGSVLPASGTESEASFVSKSRGNAGFAPEAALVSPEGVKACNVTVTYGHPGHGDEVTVNIWLPISNYNQRFVGIGGGGWSAGEIGTDFRSSLTSQGYAVATTNAGYDHDMFGTADPWLMKSPGNLDYPLIVNFAHRSLHEMTIISKHIIEEAYGSAPKFSYWQGCSTGGRQGLTIAQKFPEDYDGILTSCPAVNFSALLLAMYWPQLVMNLKASYPQSCEFEALVTTVAESCKGALEIDSCGFEVSSLIGKSIDCQGTPRTISETAVEVYDAMLKGPADPEGAQLFPGITLGTAVVGMMAIANTFCEGENCSRGLPFTIADDWIRLMVKKDPSFDPSKMSHAEYSELFRESVMEWDAMFSSNNADLQRFRLLGKKMLAWHSTNDEAVPMKAMRQYYDRVLAADNSRNITTQHYYRYFEVPGATHCLAPAGVPYPLKALDTLRLWVEKGIVPGELPAVVLDQGQDKGEFRQPICAYPATAVSEGSGFACMESFSKPSENTHVRDEL
ncbi:tannase and feruloyl esterase [Colletotrichum karsti]|uniref:Carboxylic ester hydrolase n=1 Tax=Colletotrichum karsti TaxID=1095194 RepID=A0A9P6IFF6_9PEZI|nr:tannase and feruloyl esterase [Colletotrichum karsti]KAF9881422.1 tannase and feruloyl esterase [Colletotrichum karsti]